MLPKPSRKCFVYISGPITPTEAFPSIEENSKRLFEASLRLFERGYSVYCPKVVWFKDSAAYDKDWFNIIEMDLEILSRCDAVYFLKGWNRSKGCTMEYERALQLKLLIEKEK